jgi:hypothetical protein
MLFVGHQLGKSLDEIRAWDEDDLWLEAAYLSKHKPDLKDSEKIEQAMEAFAGKHGKVIRSKIPRKK